MTDVAGEVGRARGTGRLGAGDVPPPEPPVDGPAMTGLAEQWRPQAEVASAPGTAARRVSRPGSNRGSSTSIARRWLPPLALLVLLIAGWELWVIVRHTPAYVLPSPGRVAGAVPETLRLLPGHVATTVAEALTGLVLGAAAGAGLAFVLTSVPLIRRVLYPLLVVSQTVPIIVLAPLLVLGFGYGLAPKIVVVALISFFPVVVSTVDGLDGADGDMVDLVLSMGGDRRRVFRTVRGPSAVPAFFSGLRIAAAYAVGSAVIGEFVGASSGIGVFIDRSKRSFYIDRIFVAVLVTSLLSVALFGLVTLLGRLATPWQQPTRLPGGNP